MSSEELREQMAFMRLMSTLFITYTPGGAITWLTSRNRNLDFKRPIDEWMVGNEDEVQAVADLIDGGL